MKYSLLAITFFILAACAGYRTTGMSSVTEYLGAAKSDIINKYGTPFKTEAYTENDKLIEVISYKEAVDVGPYTYILTTNLQFVDNKLVRVKQVEDAPPTGHTLIRTDKNDGGL